MTTITLESLTPTSTSTPTGRLEELVDRLLATLFRDEPERTAASLPRTIHEGRRLRQSGDLDGALVLLAGLDTASASEAEARWLYAEWLDIARHRFADCGQAVIYSPATGRAAVLLTTGDDGGDALEVAAVLGMRWPVGKTVSRRSLRGLKPLTKGGA